MAADSLLNLSNLTLCDYFAVIGFDKSTGIQIDKLAELSSDLVVQGTGSLLDASKSPLDCSYEAKVLCHFPNHREGFPFAYEIASLCMPKGLKIYTERKVPKEPNFHSFVLVKEDGTRVNGCSLIFYEPLLDGEVRQQIYNLQMEYIRQMAAVNASVPSSANSVNDRNSNPPPVPPPHQNQPQYPPGTSSFGDHTLPRKVSSRRAGRGSTSSTGEDCRKSPRRQQRHRSQSSRSKKRMSFYDSVSKPIFVSKCICFVTRAPIVYSVENLLRSLWAMVTGKFSYLFSPVMPIESVIYWVLHEVPLPLPGTCLQIQYGECNLVVKRPSGQELPLFDYPIQILFSFITVDRFIKLFTCFMLEHQILICSKQMDRLMLVAECLSALIFPFRWQLTYVPILPYSQLKFMEAPVPYLMGLCYDDKIPEQIFQSSVCIFDIDTGRLDYPEDIPSFPRQREIAAQISQIQLRFLSPPKGSSTTSNSAGSAEAGGGVVLRRNARSTSKNSENESVRQNRNDLWTMKRMSRSFDNNISFTDEATISDPFCDSQSQADQQDDRSCSSNIGEPSTSNNNEDGAGEKNVTTRPKHIESYNAYLKGLKYNRAIRDLFLCNFASLFASYEHFLIGSANEQDNRESMVNFDKVSFLSDQPESYLPFLAAFLETQMFTSFVDAKILSHCQAQTEESRYISYFDRKISHLVSIVANDAELPNPSQSAAFLNYHRTPVTERPLDFLFMSPSFVRHQEEAIDADIAVSADYEVEMPHLLSSQSDSLAPGCSEVKQPLGVGELFPELNPENFEMIVKFGAGMDGSVMSSPWRQQHRKQRVLNVLEDAASRLAPNGKSLRSVGGENAVESPMKLAQQNKKFVEQLLKETKTKTKRMLVAKMGKEAVHLGHGDLGITGVEENTLVAGLCDLLERIWAHGLKKKQGKSALWAHIFSHYDREKFENLKPVDRYSNLSPGMHDLNENLNDNDTVENEGENAKTLNDLLDSIRSIAKSIELLPVDEIPDINASNQSSAIGKENVLNEPTMPNNIAQYDDGKNTHQVRSIELDSLSLKSEPNNNKPVNSNWQNSLLKAANFIYDKIDKMAVEVPRSLAVKNSSAIASNIAGDDEKKFLESNDEIRNPKEVRRGRSTERRSTANSESYDSGRDRSERSRDDSKARFYHHEDDFSKRLRRASRQRRAEAAVSAAAATIFTKGLESTINGSTNNRCETKAEESKKKRTTSRDKLPPTSPFMNTDRRLLPPRPIDEHSFASTELSETSDRKFEMRPKLLDRSGSSVTPSIEEIVRMARCKIADVTLSSAAAFNNASIGFEKFNNSMPNRGGMHKSSSVSDFAPHWSGGKGGYVDGDENGMENSELASMTPGESRTLGRPAKHASQQREPRKRSLSRSRGVFSHRGSDPTNGVSDVEMERNLPPLPTHMAYDLKNVMRMTEIKTDIGFARAFVRLALERKLLHKHLKAVLSDSHLLQKMYKRYAFLRCEEEREQFLYHILSLNAVDFSCFTHTFISTSLFFFEIRYEVALVASIDRFSSSSIWIMIAGSLGSTSNIYLPSNSLQFKFDFKNLGILSTLRIGHSAGEKGAYPSKWFLDYVLVRNNVTAQTYCFHCGRWFGRGVDDGALERLLVAENFCSNPSALSEADAELENAFLPSGGGGSSSLGFSSFGFNNFISRPESPVSGVGGGGGGTLPLQKSNQHFYYSTGSLTRRRRSPSVGRSGDYSGTKQAAPKITDLQHKLGMAVNALVKHFFTEKDYRSSARLTLLLCGENGLVPYLEQVFELGRQDTLFSNRFFRQPYPWDYIERVFSWFANFFRNGESRKLTREQRSLIIYAYNLVVKISANNAVGKEGRFHIFILLTLRDHILSGLLPLMAWTPVTMQVYDESAFLRQPQHLTYLSKLLNSLNEFNFTLEKSLVYGIEL